MFQIFKRLKKRDLKNIINFTYEINSIKFILNDNFNDINIIQLYNNVFNELVNDGIGNIIENTLIISHENFYKFLEDERSTFFHLPKFFNGIMEVKHKGFLDKDAKFEIKFIKNNNLLFNPKIVGSILQLTENNYYILPKPMYLSFIAIEKANKNNDAALRYSAIEIMQSFEEDGVHYKGLKENDYVKRVEKIGIDIIEQENGELDIYPLIPGLDTEFIIKNTPTILNHSQQNIVLTNINHKKIMRYVLEEKQLKSAKTVIKTKKIPKEQAELFKTNPESFFKEEDIKAIDFTQYRLFRITGIRTEPYIGFFGSTKIETPMSKVLEAGDDISFIDLRTVKESIENLDEKELEQLKNEIIEAKQKNEEYISFNKIDNIPLNIIDNLLKEKLLKQNQEQEKNEKKENEFLGINPNDEKEFGITPYQIVKINYSDKKKLGEWQNISPNFEPKPHQIVGFNWLKTLYLKGYRGGLLADDMGLGKTFQVIAFINYLYNSKKLSYFNHRILIVAPSILLTSWKNEIENVILDKSLFKIKILKGKNSALKKLCEAFKKGIDEVNNLAQNNIDIINLLRHNIFITTYETLSINQLAFANKDLFNFKICVFDEAQKIKNPNARVTQAAKAISANIPFTIVVTGTPIENELRDLWSLLDAFDPAYIGSWKSFRENYVKPLNNEKNILQIEKKLRNKIGDYMLRRLKKDHLQGLPKKHLKYIDIPMDKNEIELHNKIVNTPSPSIEKLQKLRLLSLHPQLLNLEDNEKNLFKITEPKNFFNCSKMKALLKILDEIKLKEEKVLIFVIRHSMQTLLQTALQNYYGIKIDIINGKNNKQTLVDKKIDNFQNKKGFNILILSPLAAGVGLTITEANHVIHLERHWNPAKEDQASDRVYRIGQKKDVYIYHLIHKAKNIETFDSGLNKLIIKKKSLSDGTLIPTPSIKDSELVENFSSELSDAEKWDIMNPKEFEIAVMNLYEKLGYKCHITSKIPTEYGADIIGIKNDEIIAIQCKHTSVKKKQGREAIRQLIAETKLIYPEAKLIAITNYYFNDNAKFLAKSHNIELIERDQLLNLHKLNN
jgi:SNF2 family DNA or RNA helicase